MCGHNFRRTDLKRDACDFGECQWKSIRESAREWDRENERMRNYPNKINFQLNSHQNTLTFSVRIYICACLSGVCRFRPHSKSIPSRKFQIFPNVCRCGSVCVCVCWASVATSSFEYTLVYVCVCMPCFYYSFYIGGSMFACDFLPVGRVNYIDGEKGASTRWYTEKASIYLYNVCAIVPFDVCIIICFTWKSNHTFFFVAFRSFLLDFILCLLQATPPSNMCYVNVCVCLYCIAVIVRVLLDVFQKKSIWSFTEMLCVLEIYKMVRFFFSLYQCLAFNSFNTGWLASTFYL